MWLELQNSVTVIIVTAQKNITRQQTAGCFGNIL